jgi:PilZ domain
MVASTKSEHTSDMDERRKEQRYSVRQDAFVWDFPNGGFHPAVIEDVSRSGMRLHSEDSLQHGSQIAVDLKGVIVCGTVQYCRPLEDRFAAGIRINHVDDRTFEEARVWKCI